MNTVSVWKRSVAIFLAALMIVGMIPLSQMMATETLAASTNKVIYLKAGVWNQGGAWFAAWAWADNNDGAWYTGSDSDGDGVYEFSVPSDVNNFIFLRMSSGASAPSWTKVDGNGNGYWNRIDPAACGTNNCYSITDWGSGAWSTYNPDFYIAGTEALTGESWNTAGDKMNLVYSGVYQIVFNNVAAGDHQFKVTDGTWDHSWGKDGGSDNYTFTTTGTTNVTITFNFGTKEITVTTEEVKDEPSWNPVEGNFYYVDTDLVDYFNDDVMQYPTSTNYQSFYKSDSSQYAFMNQVISGQNYTYPMYFGNLYSISNRYGYLQGHQTLNNWYSVINVAPENNYNAVVQGLVGTTLKGGNLTDPKNTDTTLFYFDKNAADTWKGPDTSAAAGNPIMSYYGDLQFPFEMETDSNGVTTYSYDSKNSGYYVFFDKDTKQFYTSDTPAYDNYKAAGFYPFSEPNMAHSEVNNAFGTKFTIEFTVSDEGKIKISDSQYQDILFSFTGDDDVWVFIDDQLVLDMGGAHTMASGTINFATLEATVTNGFSIKEYETTNGAGSFANNYKFGGTYSYHIDNYTDGNYNALFTNEWDYDLNKAFTGERATVSSGSITTGFPETLAADFRAEYENDAAEVHTLTMFYMERGMYESNMSISFTISPLPSGLTVSKDIDNVNAGLNSAIQGVDSFDFSVNANNGTVEFDNYVLTDHNGVSTDMTTSNNTIVGVRGDKYASSFTNASGQTAFTEGTDFVITESIGTTVFKYNGVKWSVYDADDSYKTLKTGTDYSAEFSLADDKTSNYALNFVNSLVSGNLSLKKIFSDDKLEGYDTRDYTFTLTLDLDGSGTTFTTYKAYPNVVYTIDGGTTEYKTDENGQFTLKAGQTATFKGIPAGAKYQIVEATSDLYTQTAATNLSGTITANSTIAATITNATKVTTLDKTIYVVKGKDTPYTLDEVVSINTGNGDIVVSGDLTVTASGNTFTVTGNEVGKSEYTYSGTDANGGYVAGTVTVYVYEATEEVYVFDFGLSSNLAQVTGSGLFEDGTYRIEGDGAVATLQAITGGGNQTDISFKGVPTIDSNGKCSAEVTFTPIAFMSQVESYTYTVQITASKTFDANDPETGCIVTGTIKVMPANTVYYEDNFNASADAENEKIIFSANAPTSSPALTQSNNQSTNYGKDDCYDAGYTTSNKSETTLTDGQYAYFTFKGTGFDLISRTNSQTAGLAVYVFKTDAYSANDLEYVTNLEYTGSHSEVADMVFVNNYYNNGDLYQVPVVSVRLADYDTYTVYIQCLSTYVPVNDATLTSVTIDGVRIYNPLGKYDATNNKLDGYLENEKNTTVDEFRALYLLNGKISLASRNGSIVGAGLGKGNVIVENMGDKSNYSTVTDVNDMNVQDLMNIYVHGPNNEMYLPDEFGIKFSYTVTDSTCWTMQIGAKALTSSKTVSIYARKANGSYAFVDTVTVESTTDMYYDLTAMLTQKGYGAAGSYDIIIISDTEDSNSNFVSLTTVKYSGMTLN